MPRSILPTTRSGDFRMFEGIQRGLSEALKKLRGRGRLTEANIREGLREVRRALLEADVNFNVVNDFIERVAEQAVGQEVLERVDPSEQIVQIVYDELVAADGAGRSQIPLRQGSAHRPHALRPAGLRQDDHRRQARPDAARPGPQAAARRRRLAAPRRRRAAQGPRRADRASRSTAEATDPGRGLPQRRRLRQAEQPRHRHPRHRRPAARSTRCRWTS